MIKTKIPNSRVFLSIDEYFLFINLKHDICKYFREFFNRFPYRELLPQSRIRDCFVVSFMGEMDLFRHLDIYFGYDASITKITLQDMINTIKLNVRRPSLVQKRKAVLVLNTRAQKYSGHRIFETKLINNY